MILVHCYEKYLNDFKSFIAKVVEDAKSSNVKIGEVEFELVRVKSFYDKLDKDFANIGIESFSNGNKQAQYLLKRNLSIDYAIMQSIVSEDETWKTFVGGRFVASEP